MPRSTHALRRGLIAGLACLAAAACRATDHEPAATAYPPVESASFGSMRNVSITGTIWFGGLPGPGDLELAQRRGVKTVLDLTSPEEASNLDAEETCRRLGLEYSHPAVPSGTEPSDALVEQVVETLSEERDEPTLLYCGSGARCATLIAIYRAVRHDVPVEDALVEARRAGMRPQDEAFVRQQVARLRGEEVPERTAAPASPDALPAGDAASEAAGASASEASAAKQPFVGWSQPVHAPDERSASGT